MKVYQAEIDAGLATAIDENCRFTVACQIQQPTEYNSEALKKKLDEAIGEAANDAIDLYPVRTIMVSTGWNGNTDIFDLVEAWEARSSPVNKPFNVGHIPRQIIGHIIGSYCMTDDLTVIPDDTVTDNLPDKFHIVTDAVIYKHLGRRDSELTDEVADIITGIENGDWYVSMECLFSGFDYGLRDLSTGEHKIVRREENTAFLTKHLRQYRGSGVYANYEVGRVLRGITFSGKGLVENPANPESVFIFNDVKAFAGLEVDNVEFLAANDDVTQSSNYEERQIMNENLETQLAEMKRERDDALAKLREMDQEAVQARLDSKDAEISKRDDSIVTLEARIEELEVASTEADKSLEAANEAKVEVETKLSEAETKLAEIEAEAKKTNRVSLLVDKNVDKAKAEEVVAEFADLADDKFEKIVEMQSALVETAQNTEETEETDEASAEETDENVDDDGNNAEADAVAEAEEEDGDADLATPETSEAEQKDSDRKKLSAYLGSFLKK
jgi:hypothetical protein